MLIKFTFSNFKSFKEETTFNMTPSKIRDISYSILKDTTFITEEHKGLCSSVIYGSNASGKSNLLLALDFFKTLVLDGKTHLLSSKYLIDTLFNETDKPITFNILFTHANHLFEYSVSITREEDSSSLVIEKESLYVDNKLHFERDTDSINIEFKNTVLSDCSFMDFIKEQSLNSLNNKELFLSNGYKIFISKDIYSLIREYLTTKLIVVNNNYNSSDNLYKSLTSLNLEFKNVNEVNSFINRIIKDAGIEIKSFITLEKVSDFNKSFYNSYKLFSTINGIKVPSDSFESEGTLILIKYLFLIMSIIKNGGTLFIDNIDSNLHPNVIINIVNMFHNDERNINKSQLVFTTYNPIYLKVKIFRRDEIKIVDRSFETSKIYDLSSFGTTGVEAVKNSTDLMKNYLNGVYGGVSDVDFSSCYDEVMGKDGK